MPAHRLGHGALGDRQRAAGDRLALAGVDEDVLLAVHRIADRAGHDHAAEYAFPQHLAGFGVECPEAAVEIAPEHQVAGGDERRSIRRLRLRVENFHLAGRDIDLGEIHELVGIDAGPHYALTRSPAGLALEVRGHRQALVLERDVDRVVLRIVGDRPKSPRVVIAAEDLVAILLEQLVGIDPRHPGLAAVVFHIYVGFGVWGWV